MKWVGLQHVKVTSNRDVQTWMKRSKAKRKLKLKKKSKFRPNLIKKENIYSIKTSSQQVRIRFQGTYKNASQNFQNHKLSSKMKGKNGKKWNSVLKLCSIKPSGIVCTGFPSWSWNVQVWDHGWPHLGVLLCNIYNRKRTNVHILCPFRIICKEAEQKLSTE